MPELGVEVARLGPGGGGEAPLGQANLAHLQVQVTGLEQGGGEAGVEGDGSLQLGQGRADVAHGPQLAGAAQGVALPRARTSGGRGHVVGGQGGLTLLGGLLGGHGRAFVDQIAGAGAFVDDDSACFTRR